MSNLAQFTNKENLQLLWEVLLDELNMNTTNKKLLSNIEIVFESNIKLFSLRATPTSPIIELNKQFLSQVVLAVNRLFPNQTQQNMKRITISDEEFESSHEPYKIEDIHSSRQIEFEKEVERKRMELENYMTPQKPRELDFSDIYSDGKIKTMDSLIADKMVQRNLEIEEFQHNNYNTNVNSENWFTSKETSVKNEKNILTNPVNTKLKHISFDTDNNVIMTIDEPKKKVSWDDTESISNIFNKLKKQVDTNNMPENKTTQYIEQKSIKLPEVNRAEQINFTINPNISNEPVIPKTEIIKQLNDMNKKIDTLYEMINKLTSLIEIQIKEVQSS